MAGRAGSGLTVRAAAVFSIADDDRCNAPSVVEVVFVTGTATYRASISVLDTDFSR